MGIYDFLFIFSFWQKWVYHIFTNDLHECILCRDYCLTFFIVSLFWVSCLLSFRLSCLRSPRPFFFETRAVLGEVQIRQDNAFQMERPFVGYCENALAVSEREKKPTVLPRKSLTIHCYFLPTSHLQIRIFSLSGPYRHIILDP